MRKVLSGVVTLVLFIGMFLAVPIVKSAEPAPTFSDSFENKVNTDSTLVSSYYSKTIASTNKISFVSGKVGMGIHLDTLSSYVGYNSKYINPEEGTIRFYYKPDSNIYTFYNTSHSEWTDSPRYSGYLIDTVGYLSAFTGAFSILVNFSGDPSNKSTSMNFQTWSGSNWSQANFSGLMLSSDKFYDIAFSWSKSEGTIKIYVDGVLKATGKYNTPLNNQQLFFIGQNPFQNYWPYGPHSLIGTYDELKIYNVALKNFDTGLTTPTNPSTQSCNLFSDNFERGQVGSNWTIFDDAPASNWIIQNGQLYQNNNVYRSDREYDYFEGTNIIAGNSSWADYTFSFDVTPVDDDGVGAVFRYKDQSNYYRFIMVQDTSNMGPFRRIDKIVNGQPFQVLAIDKANSFELGKTYHVTISAVGSTLKVFVNGQEILSASDSTFQTGKIGLMTYASYAYFDNVCVSGSTSGGTTPTNPKLNLRAYPGDNKVYLEWDPPADTSNVVGYYLYRSKQPGAYTSPAFDFPIKETKYVDPNVSNGTTYYYICKAVYKDNSVSAASNEVSVVPKAPSVVVNVTDNQKVSNSSFTFTGKVDPGSTVLVNGKQVNVDASGNFTANVTLNGGSNTITVQVTNKAGDTVKVTKVVTYETTTPPTSGQINIVLQINNPYMTVNGLKKEIDPGRGTVPVIVSGRTLVPIRAIIEEIGGTVAWDGNAKKVTIKLKETTIELVIDNKKATVNGKVQELDVAPQIINSRTMLPLRFVTEQLGCVVDWNGDTKTVGIRYSSAAASTPPTEQTGSSSTYGEKVFTAAGGEMTLSDGTKLTVPPNAFAVDTKVTLMSAGFGTDSKGVDITGLQNLRGELTLTYVLGKGLSNDTISVYGVDMDDGVGLNLSSTYDQSTGIVTVKISPSALTVGTAKSYLLSFASLQGITGALNKIKVVFQWTSKYVPSKAEYVMDMPYYGQMGENCWAASTNMLIRGYVGPNVVGEPLSHAMRYIGVDDDDYGISFTSFVSKLPNYISSETGGKPVKWKSFINNSQLKSEMLKQLDAGHPFLLRYFGQTGFHCVLVIGYKDQGETFVIHDPKDVSPPDQYGGAMYMTVSWSWLEKRLNQVSLGRQLNPIIWIDEPLGTAKTLQTIEATGGNESHANSEGEISFSATNPILGREVVYASLQFMPSDPSGYTWVTGFTQISEVPSNVEKLKMTFPIWNASFDPAKLTTIIRVVAHGEYGSKEMFYSAKDVALNPASYNTANTTQYSIEIPIAEIRNPALGNAKGEQDINIEAYIRDFEQTDSMRDRFDVDAVLSVVPVISSVTPAPAKAGDTITIKGYAFGKQPTAKSRVTVADQKADIVSWGENQIKVKLGTNLEIGPNPVVVYTGQQYEYKSNTDVPVYVDKVRSCTGQYNFTAGSLPRWANGKWDPSKSISMYISLGSPMNDVGPVGTCEAPSPTPRYSETVIGSYNTQDSKPTSITFNFAVSSEWSSGSCKYGEFYSGTFTGTYSGAGPFVPAHFAGTVSGDVRNYRKCGLATDYDEKGKFTASGNVGKVLSIQDDSGGN